MTDDHESRSEPAAPYAEVDSASPSESGPPRSRTERVVIWCMIAAGLAVVAIEARHYLAFRRVHGAVQSELNKAEAEYYEVTRSIVDDVLGNRHPDESMEVRGGRYDLYIFKGLLKERTLCIHYGVAGVKGEPEVLAVTAERPEAMLSTRR